MVAAFVGMCLSSSAQSPTVVSMNKQQSFAKTVPPGDYSGLTWLGGNEYAVVCNKTDDAFLRFHIDIETATGKINNVEYVGRQPLTVKRRDPEDIVFVRKDSTFRFSRLVATALCMITRANFFLLSPHAF